MPCAVAGGVLVFKLSKNGLDSGFSAGNALEKRKETLLPQKYVPVAGLVHEQDRAGSSRTEAVGGKLTGQLFKCGTWTHKWPTVALRHDKERLPRGLQPARVLLEFSRCSPYRLPGLTIPPGSRMTRRAPHTLIQIKDARQFYPVTPPHATTRPLLHNRMGRYGHGGESRIRS